jgi:hypothetical protein
VKAEFVWTLPAVNDGQPFGGDDGARGYMPLAVATPDGSGTVQFTRCTATILDRRIQAV